jgi:hypothetical protein
MGFNSAFKGLKTAGIDAKGFRIDMITCHDSPESETNEYYKYCNIIAVKLSLTSPVHTDKQGKIMMF